MLVLALCLVVYTEHGTDNVQTDICQLDLITYDLLLLINCFV